MLDLVLRGGRVCDGGGGPAQDADVGIEAGRVVAIGRTVGAALRPLDGRGRAGEVDRMAALGREGMAAGALGLATSRSPAHVGEGGRPVPSRQARRAEVDALVGAMAASGRGVLEITTETFPVSADELAWLQGLARAARRPVSFSAILDVPDRPGVWEPVYAQLRDGLAAGAAVYPQVSCRPMRFDFDLATGCASLDAMPSRPRRRPAPSA